MCILGRKTRLDDEVHEFSIQYACSFTRKDLDTHTYIHRGIHKHMFIYMHADKQSHKCRERDRETKRQRETQRDKETETKKK